MEIMVREVIPQREIPETGAIFSHDPNDRMAQHNWHQNEIVKSPLPLDIPHILTLFSGTKCPYVQDIFAIISMPLGY